MATEAAPPAPPGRPLPLFDLFLDLPHPAASSACPPPFVMGAPSSTPEMEEELAAQLSRIARFAFPEFDDATAPNVPREPALNRFSQYAQQPKTFQHYTFSLQVQSGVRLHGHVRRYLPTHAGAQTRYDVGRRGERALVILTRVNGGDLVYSAILKTVDALFAQQWALPKHQHPHPEPQKWFLHKLFQQHHELCQKFSTLPLEDRKPMVLTVDGLEVGDSPVPLMVQVDTSRYLMPTSMLAPSSALVESVTNSSILPLLRVMGVSNSLRLLSALLSEARVLLISSSPTRLAQCARSALSILAQGLLHWQHLYIPVLPPHLFQYLGAPVPYLIGILKTLAPRLDQAKGELGEMIIIDLDNNDMETRGMNPVDVVRKLPDLFRNAMAEGLPVTQMSASEMLAQDLVDLLKVDKRTLYGESTLTNVSETAAKATKAVKTGFLKLKQKGKQFLSKASASSISDKDDGEVQEGGPVPPSEANTLLPDFIYTQGSQNEAAEEEAKIAFTSFFLSMFGNMRWYLSANPGKLPQLDRKRFLQQKQAMGEGENSPIWPLLQNFCHTQMLEEFAKARVEEVRTRQPATPISPLFSQCANYHRLHSIDFSVVNVRRVARQVAQNSPSRPILQTSARRMAMLLTSNRTFEGDYNNAVAQLVDHCRECSSVLFDVMSVIWVRMRDCKGIHWKHAYQSLQILRNLLYHGPLAAVAEATDGLDKIRLMKFYNDNMRSQICTQIRQAASQVYSLLVERSKLYSIRRLCINKRRTLRKADPGVFVKETRISVTLPFKNIHMALNPQHRIQVAPVPTRGPPAFAGEQDFLQMSIPASSAPQADIADPFGLVTSVQQQGQAGRNAATQDMVGLFRNVGISDAAPNASADNPFVMPATQPQTSAPNVQGGQPTSQVTGTAPPPGRPPPQQYLYANQGGTMQAPQQSNGAPVQAQRTPPQTRTPPPPQQAAPPGAHMQHQPSYNQGHLQPLQQHGVPPPGPAHPGQQYPPQAGAQQFPSGVQAPRGPPRQHGMPHPQQGQAMPGQPDRLPQQGYGLPSQLQVPPQYAGGMPPQQKQYQQQQPPQQQFQQYQQQHQQYPPLQQGMPHHQQGMQQGMSGQQYPPNAAPPGQGPPPAKNMKQFDPFS